MTIFASDLDNTLIYSYKTAKACDICVEMKDGKRLSFMTPKSCLLLEQVIKSTDFIPITTRSLEQYKRINFFEGYTPPLALVSNGGILLVNGLIDEQWYEESRQTAACAADEWDDGIALLNSDNDIITEVRTVDGLFTFTKSRNPEKTVSHIDKLIDKKYITVFNIGDKIYIMPSELNKGTAIKRLKERFPDEAIICAGDSSLDAPMFDVCDYSIATELNSRNAPGEKSFVWDNVGCFSDFVLESVLKIIM